jgi:transcriptional regulator with PAS, ATPase and Fis domain
MRRILDILPDVAASDSTVLIQGPTGTGKELVARAIHDLSPRRKHKFVAVNCGALPDTLLESELFGYRKGAFTGAQRDKPGRFERAAKGTLFLDEIADISAALQVKLLRVLQEREYEPLGGTQVLRADVRVIAATNQPLAQQVALGRFREDLFYRLNVVRIDLPPLTQRREDIPLLVQHFVEQFNVQRGSRVRGLSEEALQRIMQHPLPGNIRQLQNIVEYAMVLCQADVIPVDCLPPELMQQTTPERAVPTVHADPLAQAEVEAIREALRQHGGHRGRTAEALGINKTTLWRKLKKYGIQLDRS